MKKIRKILNEMIKDITILLKNIFLVILLKKISFPLKKMNISNKEKKIFKYSIIFNNITIIFLF